jgi:hypothetical protein
MLWNFRLQKLPNIGIIFLWTIRWEVIMKKNINAMRFDEDSFDLTEHKKAADAIAREKARAERVRRQVRFGKIMLAVVTIIVFLVLFLVAGELGLMNLR